MNIAITIITHAGVVGVAAGAMLFNITTTFTRQPETIEQRAGSLKKEYEEIESQHQYLIEKILPLISLGDDDNPHYQAAEGASFLFKM
jgi:hypothetical protein